MDFFNPLHWSDNDGVYTVWKSVYPPLNFIFLKLVKLTFLGIAKFPDAFELRESALSVVLFILFSYLLAPIVVLKTRLWNNFTGTEKTLLYWIMVLSTPMLFTLERGNLIIYALFLLPFVLSSIGLPRALCIAVLINLKPYLALLLLYYLVRRNWKELRLCTLLSVCLFVIPGFLLGHHFWQFFNNLFSFSQNVPLPVKDVMVLPSSISAYSYALDYAAIEHTTKYSHYLNLHAIANIISAVKWFVIAWVLVALYKNHNRLSDIQIFAILLVVITNLGTWVGGYTLIFYITLLPVFITMKFRNIYCAIVILLFVPLDIIPLAKASIGEQYSYLTNAIVEAHWALGMGSVLMPILNFILMGTMLYEISQFTQQNTAIKSIP
jgi:hypothetical protein